ncbi:MAG: hypothetical protein ABSG16_02135 [Candidatus Acidiferrum sp.]
MEYLLVWQWPPASPSDSGVWSSKQDAIRGELAPLGGHGSVCGEMNASVSADAAFDRVRNMPLTGKQSSRFRAGYREIQKGVCLALCPEGLQNFAVL